MLEAQTAADEPGSRLNMANWRSPRIFQVIFQVWGLRGKVNSPSVHTSHFSPMVSQNKQLGKVVQLTEISFIN